MRKRPDSELAARYRNLQAWVFGGGWIEIGQDRRDGPFTEGVARMSRNKTFDCVDTKNRVQQELQTEWKGLSGAEIQDRIERDLATSDSPVARWWRSLGRGTTGGARVQSSKDEDRK